MKVTGTLVTPGTVISPPIRPLGIELGRVWPATGTNEPLTILPVIGVVNPGITRVAGVLLGTVEPVKGMVGAPVEGPMVIGELLLIFPRVPVVELELVEVLVEVLVVTTLQAVF